MPETNLTSKEQHSQPLDELSQAQLKQLIEKIQDWFHQLTIVDQELQSGPLTTTMPTENCEQEEIEKAVIMIEQIREKLASQKKESENHWKVLLPVARVKIHHLENRNPALTFPFSTTETSHQGTSGEQKTKTRPSPLDLTKSQEELEGKGILPRPTTPLSAIAFASPRRSSRKRSISVDAKEHYSNPPLLTVVASNEKSSSSEERKNELLEKIRNNVIEDQKRWMDRLGKEIENLRIEKQNLEENLSNKEKQVAAERRKNTQLTSECDDYKQKLADLEGSRIQLEAENKVYKRSSKDLRESNNKEKKSLEAQIQALTVEKEKLNQEIALLKAQLSQYETAFWEQENNHQNDLTTLHEQNEQLQAKAQQSIQSLQAQIRDLEKLLEIYQTDLEAKNQKLAEKEASNFFPMPEQSFLSDEIQKELDQKKIAEFAAIKQNWISTYQLNPEEQKQLLNCEGNCKNQQQKCWEILVSILQQRLAKAKQIVINLNHDSFHPSNRPPHRRSNTIAAFNSESNFARKQTQGLYSTQPTPQMKESGGEESDYFNFSETTINAFGKSEDEPGAPISQITTASTIVEPANHENEEEDIKHLEEMFEEGKAWEKELEQKNKGESKIQEIKEKFRKSRHLSNNYEYLAESLKNLTDGNDILSPTELAVKELTEEKFQLQAQLKQKQEEIDRLKNSDSGELRETITNLQSEQAALELALAEETASKTLIENKLTTDTEILNQQKQKLNQQENTIWWERTVIVLLSLSLSLSLSLYLKKTTKKSRKIREQPPRSKLKVFL